MNQALQIGEPVIVKTTGRRGQIFEVFENWLGLGNHCYLIQWTGGKRKVRPHQHDKFRRDQFQLDIDLDENSESPSSGQL